MGLRTTLRSFFWQRIGAYPVTIRGERFVCHPQHAGRWWKTASGRWEGETLDTLARNLSAEDVLWDIGANVGQIALYASRKCGRVVCFEPDAVTLQYLHWNVKRNRADNVVVVGAALAAKTGFIKIGAFRDDKGLGLGITSSRPSPGAETMVAPALGPEAWGEWLRAEPPDFVKMDIEGGEFELLPAMADWLAQHRPKFLLSLHAAQLHAEGRMSAAEAQGALEKCAEFLSFYGEFTELATGKKYPLSKLAARMSGDVEKSASGLFLE